MNKYKPVVSIKQISQSVFLINHLVINQFS